LWYRGTVGCSTLIEGDIVSAALQAVGANRVVIGHTPTVTRQVLQRHGGRVIEIDTGMLKAAYKGAGNALIIEGDTVSVVNEASTQMKPPVQHPRRVGARSDAVSAEDLAQILANGDILSSTKDKTGRTILKLSLDDTTISAVFRKSARRGDFVPELAAYRLDRLLQMEMVPVTVARNVDGKDGALQFLPEKSMNESQRAANGSGSSAWCSLPKQWNTMYVYDTLIYNLGRGPLSMTYNRENWQLMLVEHEDSFDKKSGRPRHLENVQLDIGASWIEALSNLTDERLSEHLGDVLDGRRLTALGKRRDSLLAEARK
jgi:hypothetical protein